MKSSAKNRPTSIHNTKKYYCIEAIPVFIHLTIYQFPHFTDIMVHNENEVLEELLKVIMS